MGGNLPAHIAFIMDGNGRWAEARSLSRTEGHRAGAETVRRVVTKCRAVNIPYVTLYAFSSENWGRPKTEVRHLFALLREFLSKEIPLMDEQGIALNVLGDTAVLPLAVRAALVRGVKHTSGNVAMTLNLAINYGARAELARAVCSFIREGVKAETVTEQCIAQRLYTSGQPDPDLLIRTGGERRLSNFLLYQCAYSELYFTSVLWPDFREEHLQAALEDYAERSRRFGKI